MSPEDIKATLAEPRRLADHFRAMARNVRQDAVDRPLEEIPYLRGMVHGLEAAAQEILRLLDVLRMHDREELDVTLEEHLPVSVLANVVESRRGVDQG